MLVEHLLARLAVASVQCKFDDAASYTCTSGGSSTTLFTSAPIAVFVSSKWWSSDVDLTLTKQDDHLQGSDKMGAFTGGAHEWSAGGTEVETTIKNYGDFTIFSTAFPKGADRWTSLERGSDVPFE